MFCSRQVLPGRHSPLRWLGCFFALVWALFAGGGTEPEAEQSTSVAMPESATPAATEPWQIPPKEMGQQSLFRVQYDGPEGQGGFRLTLRFEAPDRYRVTTVDAVGRAVWNLSVEGESGLWVDHRNQRFCRFQGLLGLASVPLSPFALPALPALLFGRLPEPPAAPPFVSEQLLEYRDRSGRRWTARLEAGEILQWTVWENDEPAVWWGLRGEEAILSERAEGIQLRWRRVLTEPLGELPALPSLDERYVSDCLQAANPAELH